MTLLRTTLCTLSIAAATTGSAASMGDVTVEMETTMGNVTMVLYGDTPRHLENFVKLVNEGYYDGVLFHRVINDFMVQTGDPDSKTATPGQMLGAGSPDYKIDAEILAPKYFHHRGALAAAREGDDVNPEFRSSGSQFYIVTGRTFSEAELDNMERQLNHQRIQNHINDLVSQQRDTIMTLRRNRDNATLQQLQEEIIEQGKKWGAENPFKFTEQQRQVYTTQGGAPHLDGSYTVFGHVVEGMDVIDRIQQVEVDRMKRPIEDIKVLRMKVVSK